jgi:hypothetical protein
MALSKIQAESMNLADDFAFTGTVSGTSNLVHLTTTTVSSAVASVTFDNISTDYDDFFATFKFQPATDQKRLNFFFLNSSGTKINGSTDYGYGVGYTDGMSNYSSSNAGGSIPLCVDAGNATNEGVNGYFHLFGRNSDATDSTSLTPNVQGNGMVMDAGGNHSAYVMTGGLTKSAFSTAGTIRGFTIEFNSGNITGGEIVLWGIKK